MNLDDLISSVFVKNALWDQKEPQHHNRYVLDKLWDAVAEEMKCTRKVVRAKWKTVRDTFRKELKKISIKRSGDGASQPVTSTWQYFDSLSFLKDQFTARSSGGNLPDIGHETNILQEDSVDSELTETTEPDADDSAGDEQASSDGGITRSTSNTPTTTSGHHISGLKRKRQNDKDIGTALIRIEKSKLEMLQNQQKKTIDEDSSFFDSLLPHLRTLPPRKRMLLGMKIQELVYTFVYGNETNQLQQIIPQTNTVSTDHFNISQFAQLQTVTQEYSNPTSNTSYVNNFSDESFQ